MEYVIEAVLDLVLGLGIEASKNKKVPKIIRWLLTIDSLCTKHREFFNVFCIPILP